MPKLSELFFVSSNRHKYLEARDIAASFGLRLSFIKESLEEIQSDSLCEISKRKAQDAFDKFGRPVLVEDAGLFIDALNGFPGPFSSYVFQTIGNNGILDLLKLDRRADFVSVFSFCSEYCSKSFEARLSGVIAETPMGKGWGYDPIFVPHDTDQTFAQLIDKNAISHRFMALEKFSSWYHSMLGSSGR